MEARPEHSHWRYIVTRPSPQDLLQRCNGAQDVQLHCSSSQFSFILKNERSKLKRIKITKRQKHDTQYPQKLNEQGRKILGIFGQSLISRMHYWHPPRSACGIQSVKMMQ